MKIIHVDFNKPQVFKRPTALCLGYFDGVHRGHKVILDRAYDSGFDVAVLTFDRPPHKQRDNKHLTTLNDRINLFKKWNVKAMLIIPFTEQVKKMAPYDFIQYLNKLNIKQIFCGQDFRFGYMGKGDAHMLQFGLGRKFDSTIIEQVEDQGEKISTSRIIEYVRYGAPGKAMNLLGRPYCVNGKVLPGKKYGKKLGFPTANIYLDDDYVLPLNGVYATLVTIKGKTYYSMSSIGVQPTFTKLEKPLLETHIFGFTKKIYRRRIKVCFLQFIRSEIKFDKVELLRQQMAKDKNEILSMKDYLLNKSEVNV
jgi:riboflavin kinase / FMN adenylyltransferase